MFRCYFCEQVTAPKTTRHTVVIETRAKQYTTRRKESRGGRGGGGRGGFRGREEPVQDRGGSGVEIMKEVSACPACAAKQHEVKQHEEPVAEVLAAETSVAPEASSDS